MNNPKTENAGAILDRMDGIRQTLRTSAVSAVKRLAVWIKRHLCRVTEPTPEKLINDIARRNGLVAYLVPCEFPDQVAVSVVIHSLAEQAGLFVTLACPRQNLKETLQRKVSTAGRN